MQFNITTNGTLLSRNVIDFLAENNVRLMVSLDGPRNINDKNRVFANGQGTFDSVMKCVSTIARDYPQYYKNLHFSMVMDPINDFDCINDINVGGEVIQTGNLMSAFVEKFGEQDCADSSRTEFTDKYNYHLFLAWLSYWGRFPVEEIASPRAPWKALQCLSNAVRLFLFLTAWVLFCCRCEDYFEAGMRCKAAQIFD